MPKDAKIKKFFLQDAGKILRKIKLIFMPATKIVDFSMLEDFFPQLGISGVNSLSSDNIKMLIKSFDQRLLLEKGMFVLLDKFQDVGKVDENDELRIVGLLANGQWIVIKIYPNKITKFPSKGVELRDCFSIIRICEDTPSERDCADILFIREDVDKIITTFYSQISGMVEQKKHDLCALQECKEKMRGALIEV